MDHVIFMSYKGVHNTADIALGLDLAWIRIRAMVITRSIPPPREHIKCIIGIDENGNESLVRK